MFFKRKVHCLVAFIMSALLCGTVLSACNKTEEVQSKDTTLTSSTTSATTATQETTTQTTTEETTTVSETTETTVTSKLEPVSEDMPEIVFVMSQNFGDTNICGFYITNTGEVKMYDFRNIAPDEIYELPDVYDRLEEATCSELDLSYEFYSLECDPITSDDLHVVPKDKLLECYKNLLIVNGDAEYTQKEFFIEDYGIYRYYGIRTNENGEKEFILLFGWGVDHNYLNSDPLSIDIYENLFCEIPEWPY